MPKMSKQVISILMPLEANVKIPLTSENMLSVVNRITLPAEQFKRPILVEQFIAEEMAEYPITQKKMGVTKREKLVQNKLMSGRSNHVVVEFLALYLKLEKKLTYLELEQTSELLQKFSAKEKLENMINFNVLAKRINYKVQSEELPRHIIEAAKKLIKEISEISSKKMNRLV